MDALVDLLRDRRTVALIGAGCSTESGIPDYRGPETARRARNPIQHRQFVTSEEARKRYWARSMIGWPRLSKARPNPAHHALAALEERGLVTGLITQNVDGLHHRAGNRAIIELHGALRRVICLSCGQKTARSVLQKRLIAANPDWRTDAGGETAPDGDVEVEPNADFAVVPCAVCGGVLMPDVVFFGGNVPRPRVEQAYQWVDDADALLVVGSSLTVFSGYRFVLRASKAGKPVGILNLGPTRGDERACIKVEAKAGSVLPAVVAGLSGARG